MDPNLYVAASFDRLPFTLLQYNVDQAMREEKYEATKWVNRSARIRALILKVNADIVTLQEFRALPGVDETPEQFLASFSPAYRYVIEYRNSQPLAFGQVTMWKADRFYPLEVAKRWLSDTPSIPSDTWGVISGTKVGSTGFGTIVNGVRFAPIHEGKFIYGATPFWVFNTHFQLDEHVKTQSCHSVLRSMREIIGNANEAFTLSGDFNFFPDRDGATQRAILTSELQDLGVKMNTLEQKELHGTFVGYDHDEFKADLGNMVSRLDHIFLGGAPRIESRSEWLLVYNRTMLENEPEPFTTRSYPSDHLPLVAFLSLALK